MNIRNPLRYQVGIGMALLAAALILVVDMISNRLRVTLERIDSQLSREARDSLELKGVKAVGDGLRQPWTRERVVLQGFAAVSLFGWLYAILAVGLHPWRFVTAIWETFAKLHLYFPADFTTHWTRCARASSTRWPCRSPPRSSDCSSGSRSASWSLGSRRHTRRSDSPGGSSR